MADRTGTEDNLSISSGSGSEDEDSETDFEDEDDDEAHLAQDAPPAWRMEFRPDDHVFTLGPAQLSPHLRIDDDSTPLHILKTFITDDMIQNLCDETNKYVGQVKAAKPNSFQKWKDVSPDEMWRFVFINLAMGIVKKPSIKMYWSTNQTVHTPFFGNEMSRNRFESILSALHLHDKENVPANCTNRYIKLGSFLPKLLENFKEALTPGEYLCLDESLLGYKGRISFRQFNPMKRSRFGLLFYVLADCERAMILDILPYQGKATNLPNDLVKELGRGGATVCMMMEPHLRKKHKIVTDNFFNSPTLARRLLAEDTYMLGTAQKRRVGMPKMTGKMKKGEVKTYCDGTILLERWNDRREVVMMNTFHPHAMEFSDARNPHNSRVKPKTVLLYNKTMGAIDTMDRTTKPYATLRKTYKWYKKVLFHLIDVAIYNAFHAYRHHHKGGSLKYSSYLDFLQNIVDAGLEEHTVQRSVRGRPSSIQKPETVEFHVPIRKGKSDCVLCRKEGKRSQVQIKCSVCDVRLCFQKGDVSCFQKYHENLKKPKPTRKTLAQRAPLADVGNSLEMSGSFNPQLVSTPQVAPFNEASNEDFEFDESEVVSESLMTGVHW